MTLSIGTTIRDLRNHRHVTQDQLAAFLGVTPQAVSRWEAGNGYPDIEFLPALADFFGVTTDDLLGINRTARAARLAEIYAAIDKTGERAGLGEEEDILAEARQFAAEFPADERVQVNLANCLCRCYMWDDDPKLPPLREAERIYRTVVDTTENDTRRCEVLKSLCSLYQNGFHDIDRVLQTVEQLPTMRYTRESVKAQVIEGEAGVAYTQDYLERLTDTLGTAMCAYVINTVDNVPQMWEWKAEALIWIIGMYGQVFGENLLSYHGRVAYLWRVIATYRVAQGRYDETLDCLEAMCRHLIAGAAAKPGDRFDSPFTNRLILPEMDENCIHNDAWYSLEKLTTQRRYDPIRETPRFRAIESHLREFAK